MKISSPILEAFLKCPTKCYLCSRDAAGSGNEFAEWVRGQNESYHREATRRLLETIPETERAVAPPAPEHLRSAKWRLAVDVTAEAGYQTLKFSRQMPITQT